MFIEVKKCYYLLKFHNMVFKTFLNIILKICFVNIVVLFNFYVNNIKNFLLILFIILVN